MARYYCIIYISLFFVFYNKLLQLPCEIIESGKGQYFVTVKPTLSGLGMLIIKKDKLHISGSPWELNILPGMFYYLLFLIRSIFNNNYC